MGGAPGQVLGNEQPLGGQEEEGIPIWTALDTGDDYLSTNHQAVLCHTPENHREMLDFWKCAVRGVD